MLDADGNPLELGGNGVVGVLYSSHGWGQLASQAIGGLTVIIVGGALSYGFFKIQNTVTKGGIRSDREAELEGVDLPEMGVLGYPEFMGAAASSYPSDGGPVATATGDREGAGV